MSWRKLLLIELLILLIIALVLAAGATQAGRWLERADALHAADAIIILGGEHRAFYRTQEALALYEAGYASTVVFSGGTLLGAGLVCSSAALSLEAATTLGFDADAAVVVDGSQSTYDEANNIERLVNDRGWQRVILITNSYHTRRAGQTFQARMPTVEVLVRPAPTPDYDATRWWQSESGLQSVVNELIKLGFYWYQYDISPL